MNQDNPKPDRTKRKQRRRKEDTIKNNEIHPESNPILLTPLTSVDTTPITNMAETLIGITHATAQLLLNPSNFQNFLLNAVRRSVGFQRQTITSDENVEQYDMDVDDEMDDNKRNSLYMGFIHKDDDKVSHVSSNTNLESLVNRERNNEENDETILVRIKVKELKIEEMMNKVKLYNEKIDRLQIKRKAIMEKIDKTKAELAVLNNSQNDKQNLEKEPLINNIDNEVNIEVESIREILETNIEVNEGLIKNEKMIKEVEILIEESEDIIKEDMRSMISIQESTISNHPIPTCFKAHEGYITGIDFDEESQLLATSCYDGTIRIWDINNLEEFYNSQFEMPAHFGPIYDIKMRDGILASGGKDQNLRIWNARSLLFDKENQNNMLEDDENLLIEKPLLSPNLLPSVSPNSLRPHSGLSINSAPPAFSLNDNNIILPSFTLKGHKSYIKCIDMDEKYIISGSDDGTMKQWDIEKGKIISNFDLLWNMNINVSKEKRNNNNNLIKEKEKQILNSTIGSLKFISHALASGSKDGLIRMWDIRTGQCHRSLVGHKLGITYLSFDTFHLISGSLDHTINVFDLRTGRILESIKYNDIILDLKFNNNNIYSTCNSNNIQVYQRNTFQKKKLIGTDYISTCLHLNEHNNSLLSGDQNGIIKVWDV